MASFRIPEETSICSVSLRVPDLERSLHFYRDLLGLRIVRKEGPLASLSADGNEPAVLELHEYPRAQSRLLRSPGLFHAAILYPDRRELAQTFRQLNEHQWPLQGFADHGVSEALYLADPDGNGLELYTDRPRDTWPRHRGEIMMVTEPLDLDSLLGELQGDQTPWPGAHRDARIGHVHLKVSDLAKAEKFYCEILGFDVTQRTYPGALFVSAGGYHHHIGMNIWNSRGGPPPPTGAVGLMRFSIEVPDRASLNALRRRLQEFDVDARQNEKSLSIVTHDFDGIEIEITTDKPQSINTTDRRVAS